MNIRNILLVFVVFLLFAGCSRATIDDAGITRAVTEVLEQQSEAWNRGDIEGYMSGYWQSESLSFVSGG
ncbi:hypothetical protein ACFL6L_00475 [candidate division KSB1 bacterium]